MPFDSKIIFSVLKNWQGTPSKLACLILTILHKWQFKCIQQGQSVIGWCKFIGLNIQSLFRLSMMFMKKIDAAHLGKTVMSANTKGTRQQML